MGGYLVEKNKRKMNKEWTNSNHIGFTTVPRISTHSPENVYYLLLFGVPDIKYITIFPPINLQGIGHQIKNSITKIYTYSKWVSECETVTDLCSLNNSVPDVA